MVTVGTIGTIRLGIGAMLANLFGPGADVPLAVRQKVFENVSKHKGFPGAKMARAAFQGRLAMPNPGGIVSASMRSKVKERNLELMAANGGKPYPGLFSQRNK